MSGLSSLLGRMFTPQRRQSFGVSSPEPGQISFSLPILKTLGLPQPLGKAKIILTALTPSPTNLMTDLFLPSWPGSELLSHIPFQLML